MNKKRNGKHEKEIRKVKKKYEHFCVTQSQGNERYFLLKYILLVLFHSVRKKTLLLLNICIILLTAGYEYIVFAIEKKSGLIKKKIQDVGREKDIEWSMRRKKKSKIFKAQYGNRKKKRRVKMLNDKETT